MNAVYRSCPVLDQLRVPIVQAPMAGGPSTPALAAAVCEAGGLGFLAAAYVPVGACRAALAELRGLTERPFGINLFVPRGEPADPAVLQAYAERIGAAPGDARHDDDDYAQKLELLFAERPAVASFTFGLPAPEVVSRLHEHGSAVWITITSPEEARLAAEAGADVLVCQGTEAGGHRGAFSDDVHDYGLLSLLQLVRAETGLPLVATGGIATREAVAAVLALGARAAQVGTAFMRCPEAGTTADHRAYLAGDRSTALTRAFSGRLARGIVNEFMREHSDAAPVAFPEISHMTAPLRRAGDPERTNLWAGQTHALAPELPAAEVMARLTP
jgi:nitronate monooxygenase